MPTTSPTVRVIIKRSRTERVRCEMTVAQVRALETVSPTGRVSASTPFATARSLTRKGLLRAEGSEWFITDLGKQVRAQARGKAAERKA